MWSSSFSQALSDAFEKARKRNKSISLRGYAQRLGIAPGMLSEIIRERRVISFERALEICEKAELDSAAIENIRRLHDNSTGAKARVTLGAQAADLVLNPHYYQLLCALEILPAPATIADVARFLEMKTDDLSPIVDTLAKLEVIDVKGKTLAWRGNYLTMAEDVPNKKIQAFHRSTLIEAAEGLDLPVAEREYTSVTFAGTKRQIEIAKKMIRKLRDQLPEAMRGSDPDTVYRLSVQLSPLSRTLEKGEEK